MKLFVAFLAVVVVARANVPRLDDRIVDGKEVDIVDYPYQVSVRFSDNYICVGSILNANTILTSANCVYDKDPNKFSVRVGDTKHVLGSSIRVNKIIENRDYDPKTFNYDMAILKLASSISLDKTAQAVALQRQGDETLAGTIASVSGWGSLFKESEHISDSLRAVNVSVISNIKCNEKYGSGLITPRMLCAQTIDHDFCYGHSGSPLIDNGYLIGVVSWGYGCAEPQFPGVYSKVSDMYSWIISNSN